ncbi:hypothetical protein L6164_030818 [Bauhinia variegata]|uniref:Uncharacterized protein n=1 Tax=Bauhinia variegata TaxID=167791 RepID=A0ACB9LDE4_BAUVA|nr:hypothetical protein L6164_030818 [Bauhinia variegata]
MPRAKGSDRKRQASCSGTLTEISRDAVGKLLRRANKGSSRKKTDDNHSLLNRSIIVPECEPERHENQVLHSTSRQKTSEVGGCSINARSNDSSKEKCSNRSLDKSCSDKNEELDDSDWEDGLVATDDRPITIELTAVTPDSAKQKQIRRASAGDKEVAELVHKVHLLCLLARGRNIDSACDDPLIQASLLSLLPVHLCQISNVSKLTSKDLHPIVSWFHDNFHVRSSTSAETPFRLALASALESHEGSPEEITALSVALFRALNLTTRFVSILDVASLKPDQSLRQDASGSSKGMFHTSTVMVSRPKEDNKSPNKSFSCHEMDNICENSLGHSHKRRKLYTSNNIVKSRDSTASDELNDRVSNSQTSETEHNQPESCVTKSKRRGDLEFEMQLEMAISATEIVDKKSEMDSSVKDLNADSEILSSSSRMKRVISEESSVSSHGISTAVGSLKVGSPLYWAEVYCGKENLTGKWVHIDTVNMIIDGEHRVEAMVAACKTPLRYVVAFAGQGAKDVTRRYCMKWYKIASQRVNSMWWDLVLAPLRELESGATGDVVHSEMNQNISTDSNMSNSFVPTRSSLEDIELETRALTEPLPTNQQAYKSHPLYAIEKWLTKYQVLHPKGPILGFCSGNPVYPRTCVQTVKTKERWLRDGLKVKANEDPVKVIKRSIKPQKVQDSGAYDHDSPNSKGNIELYGRWQLEPLDLPPAVNGIVPKNERGQVEVWSEKCLPPGTVHLRFPRAFYVAKRLEIDYAPAMVGFEFKNGRAHPVFDGIVVCAEFKDVLLEAYAEEEERRVAEEKKRDERQALSRWYQLLSSIVTRQRLHNRYAQNLPSEMSTDFHRRNDNKPNAPVDGSYDSNQNLGHHDVDVAKDHEHVFLKEDEGFDEESCLVTKRCHCGFSVQVEEL